MANTNVYQLTDKQVYEGQDCLNVYFFQQGVDTAGIDASDVSGAYITQYLPLIKTLQESDVLHTEIRVVNLFNGADVHTEAISVAGVATYGTDRLPIFNAVGFTLVGSNGLVRNGKKRYCGIDEGVQANGVITNGTFIAQLNSVATQLFQALTVTAVNTFFPVIVKRILDAGEYRLPTTLIEAVLSNVVDAEWSPLVTSQTSRKIGAGA